MHQKLMFIIYRELKIVFIYVPRAGSGTLRSIAKRWTKDFLVRKYPKDYKCYCIVRNPYDRVYSCFARIMAKGKKISERLHGHTDFNSFVKHELAHCADPNHIYGNWHWYSMESFIRLSKDVTILRFENINKELRKIFGGHIPNVNSYPSARPDYHQVYNEESKKIVSQIYKWDIDNLGYEF